MPEKWSLSFSLIIHTYIPTPSPIPDHLIYKEFNLPLPSHHSSKGGTLGSLPRPSFPFLPSSPTLASPYAKGIPQNASINRIKIVNSPLKFPKTIKRTEPPNSMHAYAVCIRSCKNKNNKRRKKLACRKCCVLFRLRPNATLNSHRSDRSKVCPLL